MQPKHALQCLFCIREYVFGIIYKKLQAIYLMLYNRYKTAKITKYKHEHYSLA